MRPSQKFGLEPREEDSPTVGSDIETAIENHSLVVQVDDTSTP